MRKRNHRNYSINFIHRINKHRLPMIYAMYSITCNDYSKMNKEMCYKIKVI